MLVGLLKRGPGSTVLFVSEISLKDDIIAADPNQPAFRLGFGIVMSSDIFFGFHSGKITIVNFDGVNMF